jgi:hypothetical protein
LKEQIKRILGLEVGGRGLGGERLTATTGKLILEAYGLFGQRALPMSSLKVITVKFGYNSHIKVSNPEPHALIVRVAANGTFIWNIASAANENIHIQLIEFYTRPRYFLFFSFLFKHKILTDIADEIKTHKQVFQND